MSNPHNLAGYYLRNLFEVLDYIEKNFDMNKMRLHVVGHSLGAYMISEIAPMFDYIDKILLINPATLLNNDIDHHFSGEAFSLFIDASSKYLFGE